ncbi:hypothetical protein ACIRSS_23705 [Amycolatopsis sp. NPDC101161]|uniref:hypothetical protein n=1 Tax=Amycolatopsis sp. NPDC101161 TaxID=3363940 RepID=UPI0038082783
MGGVGVGVEVDARDVAGCARFVALEDEVRSVVVVRVGAALAVQHQVGLLVRLSLGRLDQVPGCGQVTRGRQPNLGAQS